MAPSSELLWPRSRRDGTQYIPPAQADAERVVKPLAESWFKWNEAPVSYEQARAQLAELILQKSQ
jgi:hypothetical protein